MADEDWRSHLSDPPRPHTFPEIMRTIIRMAQHDAGIVTRVGNTSARVDFEREVGYDLYAVALEFLDAPLFRGTDADGKPTLPSEAQALSAVEPVANLHVPADELKGLRETLCVAQSALGEYRGLDQNEGMRQHHITDLDALVQQIDRHRPVGPDGKHGNRHTATCGCDDV